MSNYMKISETSYNNNLISVIVPVYNVEPYMRKCINSIIYRERNSNQTISGKRSQNNDKCYKYSNFKRGFN